MPEETETSPVALFAAALMGFKETIDQLRFHTNGIRQGYIDDGYTEQEASAMAATDHCWMVTMMTRSVNSPDGEAS
ncbi:hypothetical protein SEA_MALIBO_14 [Gordonia phage Malibo]|nr:hypothetical protein SEA_MALIBO_14 [Gordonia phage Malibo]